MYHESTVMLHGRDEDVKGVFVTREEGGYGPVIKLEFLEKDAWEGSKFYLFLEESNLVQALKVLEDIVTKMRAHLYCKFTPTAGIWKEWNNS